jgi:Holliday junction DNA helicase RuvB
MCFKEKDVQPSVTCPSATEPSQPTADLSQPTAPEPTGPQALYSRRRKVRLVKGLPRKRLLQAIHYHAWHGDVSDRALGFYLADLDERREYQPDSVSAVKYAEEALGRDPREASALMRMSKALEELPELDRAFAASQISTSKLREIVRVAAPETELEWLAFAREHNCRQVEAAVSGARRGEKPPGPGKLGTPRVTFRIHYKLPVEVNAVWQAALEKLMGELGKDAGPIDAIKAMCEMVLATDPERRIPVGRKAQKEPVYTVVLHVGSDGRAWHQGRDGESPVPLDAVLAVMDSANVIEVPDLEPTGPDGADAIRFGERGSVPGEARDPPTPAWMRDKVLAREGHCCAICRSRKDCRTHHVDSRANGGKTIIRKLVTVCGIHHSLIHEGLIILFTERGRVRVKDRQDRVLGIEVSAREVLIDAPEEFAFTEIEVVKSPTWDHPESEVVLAPRSPVGETASSPQAPAGEDEPVETFAGTPPTARSPETGAHAEIAVEKSPTWNESAPEVVLAPHSPVGETASSRQAPAGEDEPLEATAGAPAAACSLEAGAHGEIEARKSPTWDSSTPEVVTAPRSPMSKRLAYASLDQLPAVLTASEWRALETRLEWSAHGKAFVLREDEGFAVEPSREPTRQGVGRLVPSNRPETLAEVEGQERAVKGLSLAVEAARKRGDALDHVLLSGEPGLGKTTLAGVLAGEMGSRLHPAIGPSLEEPAHVISLLTRLERRDVLFIDEIHGLRQPVTECLHTAMEDRFILPLVAERGHARSLRVELEPFTLVGATMEPGILPDAFRARFGIRVRLEPYVNEALARIVEKAARAPGLEISPAAAMAIARRSRGTPREALRLLWRARDAAQVASSEPLHHPAPSLIEASHVEESARLLEIDPDGLGAEDRRILEVLVARGRPMGLQTLAAMTGIDEATIRYFHEPYLLRKGYVIRTARGREATIEARFRMARGPLDFSTAVPFRGPRDRITLVELIDP